LLAGTPAASSSRVSWTDQPSAVASDRPDAATADIRDNERLPHTPSGAGGRWLPVETDRAWQGRDRSPRRSARPRRSCAAASPYLHILQAALVYVNTLMIQDILAEPEWAGVLTPEDLRGLTPLFWAHVLPYGEVKLNMTRRIALNAAQTVETNAESS
jgi:hypothetical protein